MTGWQPQPWDVPGVLASWSPEARGADAAAIPIGPDGVVVIDSKKHRGRLQLDLSGRLWHGR